MLVHIAKAAPDYNGPLCKQHQVLAPQPASGQTVNAFCARSMQSWQALHYQPQTLAARSKQANTSGFGALRKAQALRRVYVVLLDAWLGANIEACTIGGKRYARNGAHLLVLPRLMEVLLGALGTTGGEQAYSSLLPSS